MKSTTLLLDVIGDARMAVQYGGLQEKAVQVDGTQVRVRREGPGIEGIKVGPFVTSPGSE